jgi:MarC family membrane protein
LLSRRVRGNQLLAVDTSLLTATILLLLVIDPLGAIPLFVSALKNIEQRRRTWVILRECIIAFDILVVFLLFGRVVLKLLGLTETSLGLAGGVVLLLIALRMIFRSPEGVFGDAMEGEPFIVPLAIPLIAGPSALASVLLLVSRSPERLLEWVLALFIAMTLTTAILLGAEKITRLVGQQGMKAFDRLLGLLLVAISVEMIMNGVRHFVRELK